MIKTREGGNGFPHSNVYFSRAAQGKGEAWRAREGGWLESQPVDCCICCHSTEQHCQGAEQLW